MSFFDTLQQFGLWPQVSPSQQDNPYGLDDAAMRQARKMSIANLGAQVLAASMPMTQAQRAQMLQGFDATGGYQQNLMNAAQMKLLGDKQRQSREDKDRQAAAQAWMQDRISQMPDGPQKRNAMIYLQLGDIQKAADVITAEKAAPEYQIIDGYYVNKNDPTAPAIPVQGIPQGNGGKDVNPSDVRAAAKDYYSSPEYTTFTNLNASLGSLRENIDNPDRVSDLDFVYAAANALDPGSVVREGDYLQIVRTQGLSGELLSNINKVVGGQGLDRTTRERLYRLISGRAGQWRDAAMRKRDAVLKYSADVITPDQLELPPNIPGLPPVAPVPQTPADGRVDLPEPELLRVVP